ncbi:uncharacterized protein PADG_07322 [Paracoccidioides brasiliensis Pb18]|uniref:Uncharacterized protein n=2 Tax=Paracoccidioides brasiliensis TaxID=121759 RepID=C1GJ86_PARBD|nr:uncharacterized protein PADG_07322 [Paracoccidioides brasiliensis Pb18]EEH42502.2 hypothetical protein PADG_07322 [Paracoccidioides brasiliensis Pb18]ODH39111.1 hypothetical protein ACO22_02044 [Paracoccidioides brasiliensis]
MAGRNRKVKERMTELTEQLGIQDSDEGEKGRESKGRREDGREGEGYVERRKRKKGVEEDLRRQDAGVDSVQMYCGVPRGRAGVGDPRAPPRPTPPDRNNKYGTTR